MPSTHRVCFLLEQGERWPAGKLSGNKGTKRQGRIRESDAFLLFWSFTVGVLGLVLLVWNFSLWPPQSEQGTHCLGTKPLSGHKGNTFGKFKQRRPQMNAQLFLCFSCFHEDMAHIPPTWPSWQFGTLYWFYLRILSKSPLKIYGFIKMSNLVEIKVGGIWFFLILSEEQNTAD